MSYYNLHNIYRIRKYLNREFTKKLVHSFITSRIDYCNSLLYGLPKYQLAKLQRIQNTAAKLIFRVPRYCHVTSLLMELHWLPVASRIIFKIILLSFKVVHGQAPEYIKQLIYIIQKSSYSLRSNSDLLLVRPRTSNQYGDRSFSSAAPSLWNALPLKRNLRPFYFLKLMISLINWYYYYSLNFEHCKYNYISLLLFLCICKSHLKIYIDICAI